MVVVVVVVPGIATRGRTSHVEWGCWGVSLEV